MPITHSTRPLPGQAAGLRESLCSYLQGKVTTRAKSEGSGKARGKGRDQRTKANKVVIKPRTQEVNSYIVRIAKREHGRRSETMLGEIG